MRVRPLKLSLLLGLLALANGLGCTKKVNKETAKLSVTFRASQSTLAVQGNGAAAIDRAGISQDGRYVAFTSKATNLVPNDNNNASDVFYRDNLMKTTICVSVMNSSKRCCTALPKASSPDTCVICVPS